MSPLAGVTPGAIVLAGGRGSRLGGVRKADLVVGGRRLLDVVLGACAGCDPVVVVGHQNLAVPPGVILTRESPPFAGPAAALAAGFAAVAGHEGEPEWVLCLGCDQPGAADAVPALLRAAAEVGDGVDAITACASISPSIFPSLSPDPDQLREVLCGERTTSPEVRRGDGDSEDRIEWVLSILRTDALRRAIVARGDDGLVDCSMRRLLGRLRWAHAPVAAEAADDIDTWDDHARWQRRAEAT